MILICRHKLLTMKNAADPQKYLICRHLAAINITAEAVWQPATSWSWSLVTSHHSDCTTRRGMRVTRNMEHNTQHVSCDFMAITILTHFSILILTALLGSQVMRLLQGITWSGPLLYSPTSSSAIMLTLDIWVYLCPRYVDISTRCRH